MCEKIEKKICLICKGEMVSVYTTIGPFPGHPHVHPGPLWGYKCQDCSYKKKVKRKTIAEKKEG